MKMLVWLRLCLIPKSEGLNRIYFWECAALHNFYIVSGVRRIKGFKRWRGEECRVGTGDIKDTTNELIVFCCKLKICTKTMAPRLRGRKCGGMRRRECHVKNDLLIIM